MKKTASMKFLAMVAIVTSATVLQIREHVAPPDTAHTDNAAAMSDCERIRDGFAPAACERSKDQRQVEQQQPDARLGVQPAHGARQIWV
ncbi:hypothetical protein [Paraburkholderia antibiotica]|uniref:hypothetical protein n=1 Tax=Paraburkholderia antibiotica TaxID=2728839 RepID=UPI00198207C3|nr:hypothetical protein [Paraburkholderia antibiotica]